MVFQHGNSLKIQNFKSCILIDVQQSIFYFQSFCIFRESINLLCKPMKATVEYRRIPKDLLYLEKLMKSREIKMWT
jgi:hypothetical protein